MYISMGEYVTFLRSFTDTVSQENALCDQLLPQRHNFASKSTFNNENDVMVVLDDVMYVQLYCS